MLSTATFVFTSTSISGPHLSAAVPIVSSSTVASSAQTSDSISSVQQPVSSIESTLVPAASDSQTTSVPWAYAALAAIPLVIIAVLLYIIQRRRSKDRRVKELHRTLHNVDFDLALATSGSKQLSLSPRPESPIDTYGHERSESAAEQFAIGTLQRATLIDIRSLARSTRSRESAPSM